MRFKVILAQILVLLTVCLSCNVRAANTVQDINFGGTGASTAAGARSNLGTNNASNLSSGNVPLAQMPTTQTMPMQCRLYLSSGAPTADVTNDTTNFYVGPYGGGNIVSLPDATGNVYKQEQLTEISTAIPSAIFRLYDVFLSDNSGTPQVTTTAWDSGGQTTGSITGATAANPCVLTASNSFSGGELIGIAGVVGSMGTNGALGLNGKVFKIASATGSTITLEAGCDTTGLTYTSGGTWYKIPSARTTGLTYQNGEYLQTGNLNRVYVGSFLAGAQGTSARCDDSTTSRLVWNYFNRVAKYLLAQDTTSSWNYSTNAWRPRNATMATGTSRTEFVVGIAEDSFRGSVNQYFTSTQPVYVYQSLNTCTPATSSVYLGSFIGKGNNAFMGTATSMAVPTIGYTFAQTLEYGNAGGVFNGYNNNGAQFNGSASSFVEGKF